MLIHVYIIYAFFRKFVVLRIVVGVVGAQLRGENHKSFYADAAFTISICLLISFFACVCVLQRFFRCGCSAVCVCVCGGNLHFRFCAKMSETNCM